MGRCPLQSGSSGRPPKGETERENEKRETCGASHVCRFPCRVSRSVQYSRQPRVRAPTDEALRVGCGDRDPRLLAAAQRARRHVRLDRAVGPLDGVILHLANDLLPRPHVGHAGGRAHPMDLPAPAPPPPPPPHPLPLPEPCAGELELPRVAPPALPAPGPPFPRPAGLRRRAPPPPAAPG